VGLGAYIPANNAHIMAAILAGDAATAGGMVNMTRGLGTALGVAVVTLGLHTGAHIGHGDDERLAIAGTRSSPPAQRHPRGRQGRPGGLR
jgi:hypothetical protein